MTNKLKSSAVSGPFSFWLNRAFWALQLLLYIHGVLLTNGRCVSLSLSLLYLVMCRGCEYVRLKHRTYVVDTFNFYVVRDVMLFHAYSVIVL